MSTDIPSTSATESSDNGQHDQSTSAEDITPGATSIAAEASVLARPSLLLPPASSPTAPAAPALDYFTPHAVSATSTTTPATPSTPTTATATATAIATAATASVTTHELPARDSHAPPISISGATASGYILPPDPSSSSLSSLHLPERPSPHTAISSLSIESTTSSATITPAFPQLPRPDFPNQAYSALQTQYHPQPSRPFVIRRGTQPYQISTFTTAIASQHASGTRSAHPSPAIGTNNGLYNGSGPGSAPPPATADGSTTYPSPFLHFTHAHIPKETHVADVDVDPISGRKLINHYEIIDELGRGTHGKVKLGRDLDSPVNNPTHVAIKIVERFSKRRKLGRLGTTEDKVKKEVAVLKKARHPNVVALLEVIDDPSRKKVYIVLEWVERGEIHWRVKGPKEIAMVEARRYEREKKGHEFQSERAVAEDLAVFTEAQRRLSRQKRRELRAYRLRNRGLVDSPEAWSMELAGETGSEESEDDRLSRISSVTAHSDTGKLTVEQGGRRSSLAPSQSHPSERGEASYLSLTSEPEITSPMSLNAVTAELQEVRRPSSAFSMTDLEGTMYGPYDPLLSQTSRVASLNSLTSSRASSDNLTRYTAEFFNSHLDSELEYVPVMPMDQIRIAFRDTLLGLQYLHYQGIVHRDIKPPNLLATIDNRFKISDFGVSYLGRPIQEGESEDVSEADAYDLDDEAKELAKTVGTPAFYAPELCSTDTTDDPMPVTKAIDVWALGVTLFCMLFARTPFVDNEFVVMRQIADEEIYLPRKRLQPIDDKPKSRPSSHSRTFPATQAGRRHELDLMYEDIDDTLHDLLKRLLIKDPRKRITLEEVRHHPWVLADLPNKSKWLEETDPSRQAQGKKIEISREEMNTAVVPLNLVERMRSSIKKFVDRTVFTRTRAHSNASSGTSPSPSAKSSSTALHQEDRRRSILTDEVLVTALNDTHSRDAVHSLSRSVAASPDIEQGRVKHGWASLGDNLDFLSELSRPVSWTEPSHRPGADGSAADSMRTVKQSDYLKNVHENSRPPSPAVSGTPLTHTPGTKGFSGLLGPTSRIGPVVEQNNQGITRSRGLSTDRVNSEFGDAHGDATLAISQTTALGELQAADSLGDYTPGSSAHQSPASSRPHSVRPDLQHQLQAAELGSLSRLSSSSSVASVGRSVGSVFRSPSHKTRPHRTSADEWIRADEERVRKLVRESQQGQNGRASPGHQFGSAGNLEEQACPPSPDDLADRRDGVRFPSFSASSTSVTPDDSVSPTNQPESLSAGLVSSSSDLGSAVSMSVSNPSIPSVLSEASSVDLGDDGRYEYFYEEKHEPSPDSTINSDEGRQDEEQAEETYSPDQEHALYSGQDDEFDSSSDSDGGLVMRGKSRRGHGLIIAASTTNDPTGSGQSVRARKSSRSGSNNTMKKVRRRENGEGRPSLEVSQE